MVTMYMSDEPPRGYSYAHVLGRNKFHFLKIEPFNSIAVCGKQVHLESATEVASKDRPVCADCWKAVFKGTVLKWAKAAGRPANICSGCAKPYEHDVRGVCVKCEKCYGCCRCKQDVRVTVDADTFLDRKIDKLLKKAVADNPVYPEHDKLREVKDKTQFAHDFLRFCEEKGIHLAHKDERGTPSEDDLLYEFIGVDRWKLENEKRAMLGHDPIPGTKES